MGTFTPRQFAADPNAPDPDPTVVKPINNTASLPSDVSNPTDSQINIAEQLINEHWMKTFWRPIMAFLYMIICFMDFVGFPLISMAGPIISKGFGLQVAYVPWTPLSLTNGGLVHMSFMAILGISAWTRGKNTNT